LGDRGKSPLRPSRVRLRLTAAQLRTKQRNRRTPVDFTNLCCKWGSEARSEAPATLVMAAHYPDLRDLEQLVASFDATGAWHEAARSAFGAPFGVGFRAAFARAGRKLPDALQPPPAGQHGTGLVGTGQLATEGPLTEHWTRLDWARLWMIQNAMRTLDGSQRQRLLQMLFEAGEIGEQVSVLRTLMALEQPESYLSTAVSACRTNATEVFEAIACNNEFPSAYFPELNFNQMVMKAIFMEVSIASVIGLSDRLNPELQRMARDFASERRAAARAVPAELTLIVPSLATGDP